MSPKKRLRLTPEMAELRAPIVLKRIALRAVNAVMLIEKHGYNSAEVEAEIMSMQGYIGHLMKLLFIIWRDIAAEKLAAERVAKETPPS